MKCTALTNIKYIDLEGLDSAGAHDWDIDKFKQDLAAIQADDDDAGGKARAAFQAAYKRPTEMVLNAA